MYKSLLQLFALVAIITFSACKTMSAPSPDYSKHQLEDKGLVLFSTSADVTTHSSAIGFTFFRIDSTNKKQVLEAFFLNNAFQKSHATSEHMNVHWRALEPGKYGFQVGAANPFLYVSKASEYYFTVEPGKQLYLGNFHFANREIGILDKYNRDFDYFSTHASRLQVTNFEKTTVESRLIDYGTRY